MAAQTQRGAHAQRGVYRGTSPVRKRPITQDPPTTLGIGLRWGPRGVRCFKSEVPLYGSRTDHGSADTEGHA